VYRNEEELDDLKALIPLIERKTRRRMKVKIIYHKNLMFLLFDIPHTFSTVTKRYEAHLKRLPYCAFIIRESKKRMIEVLGNIEGISFDVNWADDDINYKSLNTNKKKVKPDKASPCKSRKRKRRDYDSESDLEVNLDTNSSCANEKQEY
jgi:hypothetical protein